MERKYPEVLNEYNKFYNFLDQQNPNKKDLRKSLGFKQWMIENPAPVTTTSLNKATTTADSLMEVNQLIEGLFGPCKASLNEATTTANSLMEVNQLLEGLFGPCEATTSLSEAATTTSLNKATTTANSLMEVDELIEELLADEGIEPFDFNIDYLI